MSELTRAAMALFERAVSLPPAEREALIARVCAGHDALAAEVRSLLEHHEASDAFMEPGGDEARALERAAGELSEAPPGARFGAWTIVRAIGEGGMGVVHLAERSDAGFRQRGALKRVRAGLQSPELVQRFLRERRILATLEHPNIARLLDGGTTEAGAPWLVMEYVDGVPLYEYCSYRALGVSERIALFLQVCAAVQYAHQQLVLHRDIKPGNLLVGADGVPRLLDFGIGKLFDDEHESGAPATRTALAPMTPEYASPEQLRGEAVGTASDVYSLGVLLYELLTGVRPYPPTGAGAEQARAVLDHEPDRPSTAVRASTRAGADATTGGHRRLPAPPTGAPGALQRALAGDLDNIVLKAMHKDPARRFASVEQFAADLRLFLGGYPVSARPDAWSYRAGKFVRRNRVMLAAGALATAALLAGLGASLWQASIAQRERALAQRRFEDVHALTRSLLFDVNDALADLPGAAPAREMIVARAQEYLERLARDAGRDTTLRLDLARGYLRLGSIQGEPWRANVGKPGEADRSFRAAHALLEPLAAEQPRNVDVLYAFMDACNRIALFDLEHSRMDEALAMQQHAMELNARLVQLAPDSVRFVTALPRRQHNLALALHGAGRDSEAVAIDRRSVAGFAEVLARWPDNPAHKEALARVLTGYAQLLRDTHGPADSIEALSRRSMALQRELLAQDKRNARLLLFLASNHFTLADVYALRRGDLAGGVAFARTGADLIAQACALDRGNADLPVSLAIARVNLGHLLARSGAAADRAEAQSLLVRERVPLERWQAADSTDARMPAELVEVHEALARIAAARQAWSEARQELALARIQREWLVRAGDAAAARPDADMLRLAAACDSALAAKPAR